MRPPGGGGPGGPPEGPDGRRAGGPPRPGDAERRDSPPAGYSYFEVAADVGVRAWGPSLEECFRQCALGVFNLIVPLEAVAPAESRESSAHGDTAEALLVNWINELLFLHDVEGFAVADVQVPRREEARLHADLRGEPVDPSRHPRGILVKAATFHQLAIDQEADQVTARLVLDV
ncbi:MAG: archease [Candidatus Rokuibacteriota bacterium]